MRSVPAALLAGAATVLVLAEGLTSWASHDGLPARRRRVGPGGVVLDLGYPSRAGGRISWMQRWRVRIAVRSAGPGARFVFSGGARRP